MSQESVGAIILPPVRITVGDPAGQALENLNTNVLGDGVLCYVTSGPGQGEWQLQKGATNAPDGVTIVAPIAGPGRWFIKILPGPNHGGGGGGGSLQDAYDFIPSGAIVTNPAGGNFALSGTEGFTANMGGAIALTNLTGNLQLNSVVGSISATATAGQVNIAAGGGAATVAATGGDASLISNDANAVVRGDVALDLFAVTGNWTGVASAGFTTLNGAAGIGLTSSLGNINLSALTGFGTLESDQTAALKSTSANILVQAATNIDLVATTGIVTVNSPQTNFTGNVTVAGQAMAVDSQITLADRFIDINVGMTVPGAITSGMSTNSNSVGPTSAVSGAAFTTTSVEVADATGFAANDVIEIALAANASNRGRFAIASIAGDVITIKGAPNNTPILQNALVADATVLGTVTKITVDAWRFSGAGALQATFGNTSDAVGWTWVGIPVGAVTLQAAYDGGNTINATNAEGDISFTLNEGRAFLVDIAGTGAFVVLDEGAPTAVFGSTGSINFTPTSGANFNVTTGTTGQIQLTTGDANAIISAGGSGEVIISTAAGVGRILVGARGDLDLSTLDRIATQGSSSVVQVRTGSTADAGATAGSLNISGGNSVGAGSTGGHLFFTAGTGEIPGQINITAGTSTTGTGGVLDLRAGSGPTVGGEARLQGGSANTAGIGGGVLISASDGGSTSGNGGDVILRSGAVTSGTAGQIAARVGGTNTLVLNPTTLASISPGRVLSWDGTQNVYVASSVAKTTATITAGATATPTASTLQGAETTFLAGSTTTGTALTLPSPAPANGTVVVLKDASGQAGTNPIVVNTAGAETVDGVTGAAAQTIATNYGSLTIQSDGTNYFII